MQGEIVPVVAELDFSAPVREVAPSHGHRSCSLAICQLLECFRPEHISSAACDVAIAIKSILTPSASTVRCLTGPPTHVVLSQDSAVANTILGRISKALSEVITGLQSAGTPRERSSETYRFVATLTQLLGRIATVTRRAVYRVNGSSVMRCKTSLRDVVFIITYKRECINEV